MTGVRLVRIDRAHPPYSAFRRRMRAVSAALALAVVAAPAVLLPVPVHAAGETSAVYETPEGAYKAGQRALKRGDHRSAIAPLRYAADGGVFLAKYALAELLADTNHIFSNPNEAFSLYSELIDSNPDVDPFYDYRARYVARAYVMKGRYLSGVLPIDGVELSQKRARRLFGHAATYLDYPDAQFEFARMLLKGRGGARNVRSGKHYLSTLSRKGHAAAQGYLAELFWNGENVPKRQDYALALSTLAVQNTRRNDRIWLGELHHEISCATSAEIHEEADRLLQQWTKSLPKKKRHTAEREDVLADGAANWTCLAETEMASQNGDQDESDAMNAAQDADKERWPDQFRLEALHGSMFYTEDAATRGNDLNEEPQ